MKPFLFIALDDLDRKESETLEVARQLSSRVDGDFGFKINLDYLLNTKLSLSEAVSQIQYLGRPVFTDLKMWNGSRTMEAVIKNLVSMGVEYLNVYALADDMLPKAIEVTKGTKTKVLGITVLTHYDDDYCKRHFRSTLSKTVRHLSKVAIERGCHGVILPGTVLADVKDLRILKAVPGVRTNWYQDTRHEQEIEPKVAVELGADILVCGSPIMKSADKISALKRVLSEMKEGTHI